MTNKNKYLESFKIKKNPLSGVMTELIGDWHKKADVYVASSGIADCLIDGLNIAIPFLKNWVECEAEGFKNRNQRKALNQLFYDAIIKKETITYFGVLCPSYKKGIGAIGFAPIPGNTTKRAFANLRRMSENTKAFGIKCEEIMFFADIAIERGNALEEYDWKDLDSIVKQDGEIADFYKIKYQTLTQFAPKLGDIVGRYGKIEEGLDVSPQAVERSMWRDRQFYPAMFGWTKEMAEQRTKVHVHSYYWQGRFIREAFKCPVMVYSAYDYEKGALYNGKDCSERPCIFFPLKVENNPERATIPIWEYKKGGESL